MPSKNNSDKTNPVAPQNLHSFFVTLPVPVFSALQPQIESYDRHAIEGSSEVSLGEADLKSLSCALLRRRV